MTRTTLSRAPDSRRRLRGIVCGPVLGRIHTLALLLVVGTSTSAEAAPPPETDGRAVSAPGELGLTWSAPVGCPDREEVVAAIERYLGGTAPSGLARDVHVQATVSPGETGSFRLAIVVETTGGTSVAQIDADDCRLLAKAAALKIAVAVDPLAVLDRVDAVPAVAPAPEPPAPADSPPTAEPEPEPAPRPGPGLGGALRVDGMIEYGVLPGFGAGIALAAGVVFPRWRFEAIGTFWPAREARLRDRPEAGGDLLLGAATLRGCPTPRLRKLEFPLCLGVEFGAMRGDGVGVTDPVTQTRLWAAAQLGVGLAWRFTPHLALWVEGQAVVALVRPEFLIVDAGRLHRANPAAPRGTVGLEVRFPHRVR